MKLRQYRKESILINCRVDISKWGIVTQGNRQVACKHLQRYDIADIKIELVREANNQHDRNAQ